MGELSGRVALVTGTAQGIGAAIADGLEEDGATVHRVDRDTADLTDPAQVAEVISRLGRIDILVNNAGGVVGQVGKPLDQVSDDEWRVIVDANLTSAFLCTRAVIPAMKAARAGWIVNISSGAGRSVSLTGIQAYASAKAGQIGFTRQMAHELGPYGITVNCIAPGFVRSNPTTERQWQSYGEEGQRRLIEGIALRRLGLGAAPPHRDVAPDPAVGLRRSAIERDHLVQRAVGDRAIRVRCERARVEAVEALGRDLSCPGHAHHFARDLDVDVPVFRIGQRVSDGVIRERGGEELRAIRELAPKVAPDVRCHDGAVVEIEERAVQLADARGHAPVDLPEHDRAAPRVLDHARLEVVRTEVHEAADRAPVADELLDRELVQTVLRGYDVAVRAQVRRQRARGRLGVLRLHGKDDVFELALEVVRRERRRAPRELRERSLDPESGAVDRDDVLLRSVH